MDKLPLRSEIDAADKWRLEDMYESDALWEKDFEKITKLLKKPAAYKGRLGESGELLLECYRLQEKISMTMEKLYVYARMRKDEDNGIAKYQEMASRIEVLAMQFQAETAFFEPELLSLGEKKIMGFLRETPGLAITILLSGKCSVCRSTFFPNRRNGFWLWRGSAREPETMRFLCSIMRILNFPV